MYFENILGTPEIPAGAEVRYREAVRGLVLHDDLIFMIHTAKGDYKFPGGGIEKGEDHLTALRREFVEETGFSIADHISPIGVIVEQRPDDGGSGRFFVMKSFYYACEIEGENRGQSLEAYEKELEFKAEFVSIVSACEQNKNLLLTPAADRNPWVEREAFALKAMIAQLPL